MSKLNREKEAIAFRDENGLGAEEPVKIKNRIVYKPERIGITQKNIKKLISLKVKLVNVKQGLPYTPAFLPALIASFVGVDIMFLIFRILLK